MNQSRNRRDDVDDFRVQCNRRICLTITSSCAHHLLLHLYPPLNQQMASTLADTIACSFEGVKLVLV